MITTFPLYVLRYYHDSTGPMNILNPYNAFVILRDMYIRFC